MAQQLVTKFVALFLLPLCYGSLMPTNNHANGAAAELHHHAHLQRGHPLLLQLQQRKMKGYTRPPTYYPNMPAPAPKPKPDPYQHGDKDKPKCMVVVGMSIMSSALKDSFFPCKDKTVDVQFVNMKNSWKGRSLLWSDASYDTLSTDVQSHSLSLTGSGGVAVKLSGSKSKGVQITATIFFSDCSKAAKASALIKSNPSIFTKGLRTSNQQFLSVNLNQVSGPRTAVEMQPYSRCWVSAPSYKLPPLPKPYVECKIKDNYQSWYTYGSQKCKCRTCSYKRSKAGKVYSVCGCK